MNVNLLKDRKFQLVGIAVIAIVVLLAGFIFLKNAKTSDQQVNTNILPTEIPIPTISPEELGLTIEEGTPGKTVLVTVENIDGITSIEYELSYLAEGSLPRGAIGQINLKKTPASKDITLGTCSDVCHYDKEISDIKVVLKITKDDGSVFQSTATLDSL
ncbi:MAG: hypothetical protein AAB532_03105 [Patescibacteria group bacterium]